MPKYASARRVRIAVVSFVLILGLFAATGSGLGQTSELQIDGVNLGAIGHIGDIHWEDTYGLSWDENFAIGGIVGKQNATIIPQIEILGKTIIPSVKADTRTGARVSGNIDGGIGLGLYADFNGGGLATDNAFDFRPTVTAPQSIDVGDFFRLDTTTGLLASPAFTADRVQLPSFEAGMDLLLDLAINGKVEGGLFPALPYTSGNIAMGEPWEVQRRLVDFGFDLNPATSHPPTLTFLKDTPLAQQFGFPDPDAASLTYQVSYGPPTNTIDIGEIQIVNPFGVEESIIAGDKPNLTVSTSVKEDALGYAFETPLLRMGLDLDGIAGYFATSAVGYPTSTLTRLDQSIGDFAEIQIDLIDIKYGAEIGYRESVEIRPDFVVTLDFDREVYVRDAAGIGLVTGFTGLWSDLPEFSLAGDAPVEVTLNIDALTGDQTKQGAFFLTDYLQLTLLEVESLALFDELDLSFPPLLQLRASLLGQLGEVELDVYSQSRAIEPIALDGMSTSFWLHPREGDTRLLYWASPDDDHPIQLDRWAMLASNTSPTSLAGSVLLVGRGDEHAGHVGQLLPMTLNDSGAEAGEPPIVVEELRILPGSQINQSGLRQWHLEKVHNDGLYFSDGETEFRNLVGQHLHITGSGEMRFTGGVSIQAPQELVHGEGHTLVFHGAAGLDTADRPLMVNRLDNGGTIFFEDMLVQLPANIDNRGAIIFDNTTTTQPITLRQQPRGSVVARGGAVVSLGWLYRPSGSLAATGAGSQLILNDGTPIYPTPPWAEDADAVFLASDGGEVLGSPPIQGWYTNYSEIQNMLDPANDDPLPYAADGPMRSQITFGAGEDGHINFTGPIKQTLGTSTRLEIASGGEMTLRGTRLMYMRNNLDDVDNSGPIPPEPGDLVLDPSWMSNLDAIAHPLRAMAGQMFIVENHGTLNVFDSNRMYVKLLLHEDLDPAIHPYERSALLNMQPNLINTGEIIVHEGASLGFQIRVPDESPRGLIFDQGTWTLLGGEVEVDPFGVSWAQGPADTQQPYYLAVNASHVMLSGDAAFPFLNTVEENRGTIILRDHQHFAAVGDLLNTGEIRVESAATLSMPAGGRLTIDEGTVAIDGINGASLIGAEQIDVIGGSFTNTLPAGAVSLAEQWVLREKWIGEDDEGNAVILPATVDFGDAHVDQILSIASVALHGREAAMTPLSGLTRNAGSLLIRDGSVLTIGQDIENTDTGRLDVTHGGQLIINGSMTSSGTLTIGPAGYLQTTALHLESGSVVIDGVVDSPQVTITDDVSMSGSTLLTGTLRNGGQLAIGSSPGIMEVYGGVTQFDTGTIVFEILGQIAGESYDQLIVHADSSFEGKVQLVFGEEFEPRFGREWLLIDVCQSTDADAPFRTVNWMIDSHSIHAIGLDAFTGDFVPADFMRQPDDVLLGMYHEMAILLSVYGGIEGGVAIYSIPEPGSLLLMSLAALWMSRHRRTRIG